MSILDDDSFESYFAVDTSPPCTAMKGRYDSCFFKSYSESMLTHQLLEKKKKKNSFFFINCEECEIKSTSEGLRIWRNAKACLTSTKRV